MVELLKLYSCQAERMCPSIDAGLLGILGARDGDHISLLDKPAQSNPGSVLSISGLLGGP